MDATMRRLAAESARSDRRIAQGRAARAAVGQARMFPSPLSLSLFLSQAHQIGHGKVNQGRTQ